MLLDHGADYDYVAPSGDTALHLAAANGRVSVVERLLKFGGVHKMNSSGYTALHVASNTDVIRVLLLAGSNAKARADDLWTPLHNAARQGNPDGIEVLLRYGANVHAPTQDGRTALHTALELRAAFDGNILRVAKLLLEKGADVNAVDDEGMSPFQMATGTKLSQATVDIVTLLINQGANVNAQDNNGYTALHQVDNSVDWADLLLEHGVIIDTRDGEGKTALFRSFEGTPFLRLDDNEVGHLQVARFLIERGADVEVLTNCAETMLHAVSGKTLDLCPVLLERGVCVNALTIEGWSPLALTLTRYSELRKRSRASRNGPIHERIRLRALQEIRQVIQFLVEKGGKNIRNWQEEECNLEE